MTAYVVAARGSRLSLAQTHSAIRMLQDAHPDIQFDIRTVSTHGDRDSRPMFAMDRRGIFEKEVNAVVASGEADFAVHSMKDVPVKMDPGLRIASVPKRADPHDVMVGRPNLDTAGPFVVGTSSLRRAAQVRMAFSDAVVKPIRGNVDTRLSKVGGEFDAVILAMAGLERLGLDDKVNLTHMPFDVFIPSPGQGALALVCRDDDYDMMRFLRSIQHIPSRTEADAERALSVVIESGCRFPVGAHAKCDVDGVIHMNAAAYAADDTMMCVESVGTDPVSVGYNAGHKLLKRGAGLLAAKWRDTLEDWK